MVRYDDETCNILYNTFQFLVQSDSIECKKSAAMHIIDTVVTLDVENESQVNGFFDHLEQLLVDDPSVDAADPCSAVKQTLLNRLPDLFRFLRRQHVLQSLSRNTLPTLFEQANLRLPVHIVRCLSDASLNRVSLFSWQQFAVQTLWELVDEPDLLSHEVIQFLIVPALFDFFRLSDEQIPPQGNNLESERWFHLRVQVLSIITSLFCRSQRFSKDWLDRYLVPHYMAFHTTTSQMFQKNRELREVLAHSLVNIAEIAGTSFTDRELFPIFQRYMRDTPEVQYALLQHLSGFCKILSAEYRENMIRELSHQVTIDPGDSRTWRQRVQFAGFELTRLVQFFPITHINRHLSGFALSFSADRISEVRICGVDMLAVVLAAFIRNEWDDAADVEPPKLVDTSTNNSMDTFCGEDGEKTPPNTLTNSESAVSNEPLELPLTDRLLADIRFGFWRTRQWRRRQSFGRLLYSLAQNKLIADEQFHYLFHNDLMKISEDDVANVRQYFCLLARHKHFDQFNGQSIRKRLERMATDDVDLENRNLAKIYAGQLAILPKNHRLVPVVEEMRREEKRHLDEMERLVGKYGVRPTALAPICSVAGFLLGAGTALMGEKAAMACEAPFYGALKTVIQTGCKTAIWITQRI
uniref:Uncharacterized protein n=1 Tax=Globodera pallida TaxID=36090 RepID=A0A183BL81_GLOPA